MTMQHERSHTADTCLSRSGGKATKGLSGENMLKKLKRLTCRHAYMWSERRQLDVCYHCGRVHSQSGVGITLPARQEASMQENADDQV